MAAEWRTAMAVVACLVWPAIGSAQTLPGVDPVKVKTIPVGPSASPAIPPMTPSRTAPPARAEMLDVPPVKVHTVPVDRKGNLVGETPPAKTK